LRLGNWWRFRDIYLCRSIIRIRNLRGMKGKERVGKVKKWFISFLIPSTSSQEKDFLAKTYAAFSVYYPAS
jgi:hypothetical protein